MWPLVAARLVPQRRVTENVFREANAGFNGRGVGGGRVVSAAAARHSWSGCSKQPQRCCVPAEACYGVVVAGLD